MGVRMEGMYVRKKKPCKKHKQDFTRQLRTHLEGVRRLMCPRWGANSGVGQFGVRFHPFDSGESGALVAAVDDTGGLQAHQFGVHAGDRVTSVDGVAVTDHEQCAWLLREAGNKPDVGKRPVAIEIVSPRQQRIAERR